VIADFLRWWQEIVWGDVATWVTGIATVALFYIAFVQIRVERDARLKRDKELKDSMQRSQAESVSCWIVESTYTRLPTAEGVPAPLAWVAIQNQSQQPVYQVIVGVYHTWKDTQYSTGQNVATHAWTTPVGVVPPGRGYVGVSGTPGIGFRPGWHVAAIAFMDAAGVNWVRSPSGGLTEINVSTLEYFSLKPGFHWHGVQSKLPEKDTPTIE